MNKQLIRALIVHFIQSLINSGAGSTMMAEILHDVADNLGTTTTDKGA